MSEAPTGPVTDSPAVEGGSPLHVANDWRLRYERTGDAHDLVRAETAARDAVRRRRELGLEALEEFAELAQILRYGFAATDDPRTAAEAVAAGRSALAESHGAGPGAHAGAGPDSEIHKRRCLLAGTLVECRFALPDGALTEAVDLVRESMAAAPRSRDVAQISAAVLSVWADEYGDLDVSREAESAARLAESVAGSDEGRKAQAVDTLADVLRERYDLTRELDVLDEAIALGERGTETADGLPEDRAARLGHLGVTRLIRYEATGERADLDEAIRLHEEALALIRADHPDTGMHLNNLGAAVGERARLLRTDVELDAAIERSRAAVRRRAATPTRVKRLSNLGGALFNRFVRFGDLADLDEGIDHEREAVRLARGGTARSGLLGNLAGALAERYDWQGARGDLVEALALLRDALDAGPRPGTLANLTNSYGVALHAWYELTGDQDALDAALGQLRKGATVDSVTDPQFSLRLANVVTSLQVSSAQREHAAADAVAVARRALVTLRDGPAAAAIRTSLLLALHALGGQDDVDEAVELARTLVDEAPEDDPGGGQSLSNLAYVVNSRYENRGDPRDRAEVLTALRAAALSEAAGPTVRLHAARSWGQFAAREGDFEQAATAFAAAVELLPDAAPRRLERPDAQRWLAEFSGLASDAAAMWLARAEPERAMSLLELGRGVLLHRTLGIRGDTAKVREADAALADRFEELRDELDQLDMVRSPLPSIPSPLRGGAGGVPRHAPGSERNRERRRDLEAELAAVTSRITALPGLAGFRRPPETTALLAEAAEGPVVVVNVSSYRCDALLLTSGGLRHVPLPGLTAEELDRTAVEFHRDAVTALDPRADRGDVEAAEARLGGVLDLLWREVAAPVLTELGPPGSATRLWWVPTQALCQLPLHAATAADSGESLVDLTVSSYSPTVTALHHSRRRASAVLPGDDAVPRGAAVIHASGDGIDAPMLPAARREVHAAARYLGVDPLDAGNCDRSVLTSALVTSSYLHLALHAKADAEDPGDSRFLLPDIDLTFADIAALRNGWGRLAYLSACETAHTVRELVDESINLTAAFQLVGFSGVIGTQWRVPDAVAETAARRFYTELARTDGDPAQALSRTARHLKRRYAAAPAAWAAHHHVGV
ncbi:hypothetical protein HY68_11485 [Streptomyces sp. AcH 505]|nr:hypothetical protein HY68_11485 [Streptomyces sp. AcH 505]